MWDTTNTNAANATAKKRLKLDDTESYEDSDAMECDEEEEEEEIIQSPLAFSTTEEKLNYLVTSMAKVQVDNDIIKKRLRSAEGTINTQRKRIEFLQIKNLDLWHSVNPLRYDVRLLDNNSRLNNLIIHGVPDTKIVEEAIGVAQAITQKAGELINTSDLDACHKLPVKKGLRS